jgi:hypothetical protein
VVAKKRNTPIEEITVFALLCKFGNVYFTTIV